MSDFIPGDYTEEERRRLEAWKRTRDYTDPERRAAARAILLEMAGGGELRAALHRHPARGSYLSKDFLVAEYRRMAAAGELSADPGLLERLRMKPVRSLSGVATVSVLTRPYPCPGECVFCPDDARMPKSYIADEPGALRAAQNAFDPYRQAASRLTSLESVGHPTGKVELLILGGTWSAYPRDYRERFVQRLLDALNGEDSKSLADAQRRNECAPRRNVGLVVETRPDSVTADELRRMRTLGVTKIQVGVQSLDDRILGLNRRGHDAAESRRAFRRMRAAGFKIQAHWMPNLLGATPESDRADFARLFDDPEMRPDELKIYPTVLVRNSPLYAFFERGEYRPYSHAELVELMAAIKPTIPPYCRVNRLARDIPGHHVAAGSKRSNLREDAQRLLAARGLRCRCIRCREVREKKIMRQDLQLSDLAYEAGGALERFLSFVTPEEKLAGYLRLSLPRKRHPEIDWADLRDAAIIRDLHIYGQTLPLGESREGAAQHLGLGGDLLARAEEIARGSGFRALAVISAVGTREYYRERGFADGELYQVKPLS
ncbi:MAG: tRNA uridine(34) 5-carboxymethylaminomethyl modification radical SAM/GNAT enzyme Elp3 [Anaerolineales bacterium]|nr:tRNA uridine(34) 5-carboxymethylaminomethyl modification radical SAM/GNAT enzyme Elp3 [Anaerolineales bacterium]